MISSISNWRWRRWASRAHLAGLFPRRPRFRQDRTAAGTFDAWCMVYATDGQAAAILSAVPYSVEVVTSHGQIAGRKGPVC